MDSRQLLITLIAVPPLAPYRTRHGTAIRLPTPTPISGRRRAPIHIHHLRAYNMIVIILD
jgi:hypothetical protein